MLRSPEEDGRGSRRRSVLAGNAEGAADARGGIGTPRRPPRRRGIPPRPHDSSKIGAIYRANQERVATRGRGSSPLVMERLHPKRWGGTTPPTPRRGRRALVRSSSPRPGSLRSARSPDRTWKCGSGRCRTTTACRGVRGNSMMDGRVGRVDGTTNLVGHPAEHFDLQYHLDTLGEPVPF